MIRFLFLLFVASFHSVLLASINEKTFELAHDGDIASIIEIGKAYATGDGVEKNENEAIKWLSIAEKKGNSDAELIIGIINLSQNDINPGIARLKSAASKSNDLAALALGQVYYDNQYHLENKQESFKWYLESAKNGNADAGYNVGVMYSEGIGVPKNYAKSLMWLGLSSDFGNQMASCYLGAIYDKGTNGVQKNQSTAFSYYMKSAKLGYAKCQYNVASMLERGNGVKKNEADAINWYLKSAFNGYEKSAYNVAVMYYNNTPPEKIKSYAWFSISAATGNEQSNYWMNRLEKDMTPYEITQAQAVADGYLEKIQTKM